MTNEIDIGNHYNNLAKAYDERWHSYNEIQIEWVLKNWYPSNKHKSVVDIGCGTGNLLYGINKNHPHLEINGIDLSEGMLKEAKMKLPNINFIRKNIMELSDVSSVDIVTSMSVIHHVNDHDEYLAMLRGLVNEKGVIFLSAFSNDGIKMNIANKIWGFKKSVHGSSLSHCELSGKIKEIIQPVNVISEILRPDSFWAIQIYRIEI